MIKIQRNTDGTPKTNRSTHAADLMCDVCGITAEGVDMNANAHYVLDTAGSNVAISITCAELGGSCNSVTFWPLINGTADAQELALVKTA